MNRHGLVIGLHGTRGVGKDTFYSVVKKLHPVARRYAFADKLKGDLHDFIKQYYGVDVFTVTGEDKE